MSFIVGVQTGEIKLPGEEKSSPIYAYYNFEPAVDWRGPTFRLVDQKEHAFRFKTELEAKNLAEGEYRLVGYKIFPME